MATRIREQLSERKQLSAPQFDHLMVDRRANYGKMGWRPRFNPEDVRRDSYFLQEIKPRGERTYSKFSNVEDKVGNQGQSHSIHSLSASGHGNMRLAAIEHQILSNSVTKDDIPNFDKFYKKTIRDRRLAVRTYYSRSTLR